MFNFFRRSKTSSNQMTNDNGKNPPTKEQAKESKKKISPLKLKSLWNSGSGGGSGGACATSNIDVINKTNENSANSENPNRVVVESKLFTSSKAPNTTDNIGFIDGEEKHRSQNEFVVQNTINEPQQFRNGNDRNRLAFIDRSGIKNESRWLHNSQTLAQQPQSIEEPINHRGADFLRLIMGKGKNRKRNRTNKIKEQQVHQQIQHQQLHHQQHQGQQHHNHPQNDSQQHCPESQQHSPVFQKHSALTQLPEENFPNFKHDQQLTKVLTYESTELRKNQNQNENKFQLQNQNQNENKIENENNNCDTISNSKNSKISNARKIKFSDRIAKFKNRTTNKKINGNNTSNNNNVNKNHENNISVDDVVVLNYGALYNVDKDEGGGETMETEGNHVCEDANGHVDADVDDNGDDDKDDDDDDSRVTDVKRFCAGVTNVDLCENRISPMSPPGLSTLPLLKTCEPIQFENVNDRDNHVPQSIVDECLKDLVEDTKETKEQPTLIGVRDNHHSTIWDIGHQESHYDNRCEDRINDVDDNDRCNDNDTDDASGSGSKSGSGDDDDDDNGHHERSSDKFESQDIHTDLDSIDNSINHKEILPKPSENTGDFSELPTTLPSLLKAESGVSTVSECATESPPILLSAFVSDGNNDRVGVGDHCVGSFDNFGNENDRCQQQQQQQPKLFGKPMVIQSDSVNDEDKRDVSELTEYDRDSFFNNIDMGQPVSKANTRNSNYTISSNIVVPRITISDYGDDDIHINQNESDEFFDSSSSFDNETTLTSVAANDNGQSVDSEEFILSECDENLISLTDIEVIKSDNTNYKNSKNKKNIINISDDENNNNLSSNQIILPEEDEICDYENSASGYQSTVQIVQDISSNDHLRSIDVDKSANLTEENVCGSECKISNDDIKSDGNGNVRKIRQYNLMDQQTDSPDSGIEESTTQVLLTSSNDDPSYIEDLLHINHDSELFLRDSSTDCDENFLQSDYEKYDPYSMQTEQREEQNKKQQQEKQQQQGELQQQEVLDFEQKHEYPTLELDSDSDADPIQSGSGLVVSNAHRHIVIDSISLPDVVVETTTSSTLNNTSTMGNTNSTKTDINDDKNTTIIITDHNDNSTRDLLNQEARYNAQLEDAQKIVYAAQTKVKELQEKIDCLEKELSIKSWNVDRLQAELLSAYKEDECVRKRLKILEQELITTRQKYCENEEDLTTRYQELETEHIELQDKFQKVQSLASTLQTQLACAQSDTEQCRLEKEKLREEKEAEIRNLGLAIEQNNVEHKEQEKKWHQDFELLRTQNADQEETLMTDCEWRLRSMQKACKQKIEVAEKAKTEAIAKGLEIEAKAKEQLDEVIHLKSYEAEVKQLRGLTNDQTESLQRMTNQLEGLRQDLEATNIQLEEEIENVRKIRVQCDCALSDKDREMIQKIEEARHEVAERWEEKLLDEMTRLTNELESVHFDARREAIDTLEAEHVEEIKTLTCRYEANEKELKNEIKMLREKLKIKAQDLEDLQTKTDNALVQTRMHLQKTDLEFQQAMDREAEKREQLAESLKEEFEKEKLEMEESFCVRLNHVKDEFALEITSATEEMAIKHKKQLEQQWQQLINEKEEALQQMENRHRIRLEEAENRIIDLNIEHQRDMKELKTNFSIERTSLESRDMQNAHEIEQLHRKCRCLTNLFEEMRMRYERRDPRPEDLREIEELRSRCESQERDLQLLTERLREMQMARDQERPLQPPPRKNKVRKPPPKTIPTSCDVIYEENEERDSPPPSESPKNLISSEISDQINEADDDVNSKTKIAIIAADDSSLEVVTVTAES